MLKLFVHLAGVSPEISFHTNVFSDIHNWIRLKSFLDSKLIIVYPGTSHSFQVRINVTKL